MGGGAPQNYLGIITYQTIGRSMEARRVWFLRFGRRHIRAGILHRQANSPYLVIQRGTDNRTSNEAELDVSDKERPPLDGASEPAHAVTGVPEPDTARTSTDQCGRPEQKPTEATEGLAQGSRP
jgi:hypothetical protein